MGGLLAAEALTDRSNQVGSQRAATNNRHGGVRRAVPWYAPPRRGQRHRVAFPDDDADKATEGEMNQHSDVQIVDAKVTDDWDAFKQNLDGHHSLHSLGHDPLSQHPTPPSTSLAPPRSPQPNPFGLPASPLVD
ncbi:hypothetical protein C8J57DRAFT_217979 [Mycena rebaudengoi]|nr:hypothetical protein C8J57DRAFT_217979 [Mycena rebaudengoi]